MAMNKREAKEMEDLKRELRMAKALSWTVSVRPDVAPPDCFGITTGYLFNSYSVTVSVACSSSTGHAHGKNDKTTTQGSRWLYSTKLLALQAMRNELEVGFAKKLAEVDLEIEKEQGK